MNEENKTSFGLASVLGMNKLNSNVQTPRGESPTEIELSLLKENVGITRGLIQELTNRLQPIMRSIPPEIGNTKDMEELSPLPQAIRVQRIELNYGIESIRKILNGLEI